MTALLVQAAAAVIEPTEPLREDVTLLVRDGRVVEVGGRHEVEMPPDADRLDLGELIAVPGLIDAHAHLAMDASDEPTTTVYDGDDLALAWLTARNAAQTLDRGVTTVRDLGCRGTVLSRLRDAIAAGEATGPRLIVSDAPITVTGGHAWQMGEACDDAVSLLRAVRRRARDGADVVKVMLTGGFISPQAEAPHRPVFDAATLGAAVREAHELGLRVTTHAHGVEGIRVAIEAGVDTIEHATMTTRSGVAFDAALASAIAEAEIVVVPTLNARWLKDDLPWASLDEAIRVLRGLHDAGVRIAIGTDGGIDHVPHGELVPAMRTLTAAGLSDTDVYTATTEHSARACGRTGQIGRLGPGACADLIAVAGDPRDDLDVLGAPQAIVADGRVLRRP